MILELRLPDLSGVELCRRLRELGSAPLLVLSTVDEEPAKIAALEGDIHSTVGTALTAPLDEVGTAAPLLDWCSMRHEIQYTRLFRS